MGTLLHNTEGFTPVIDALAEEFGLVTATVFGVIWRYCQMEDGVCTASQDKIADRAHVSRRTVVRHLQILVENGYLRDLTPHIKNKPHTYADTGKAGLKGTLKAFTNHESTVTESHSEGDSAVTEDHSGCDRESQRGVTESHTKKASKKASKKENTPAPDGAENPAQTHLNRMREKFGGDPLSVAAHCQEAHDEAGDLAGWTAPQEALGNDGAGEQLLRAFLRMKGIAPGVLPEKKAARWSRQLARLSGDAGMTEDQAVRVIETVLHPDHPDFGYYHGQYNDPANAKFKADFTAVALQVASGNEGVLAWEAKAVRGKRKQWRDGEWSVAELEGARAAAIAEEPIDVAALLGPEA